MTIIKNGKKTKMYNMLWGLFNKKKKAEPPQEMEFIIEEYPFSKAFYVRVPNHGYLKEDFYTGYMVFEREMRWGQRYNTLSCAETGIAKYKEQQLKQGTIFHKSK